jgi:putative ABC transport system permease protein
MLKNYIKIALAVLKRRKFFTFVSLFGISFTLTIIIVITAIFDHLFSAAYPDINRDRELYITSLKMTSQKKGNTYEGEMSPYFFDNYISKLKSANIKVAMHTEAKIAYTYANNKKLDLNIKYTNAQFWEVFQYAFIEGKPFTTQQIDNNEKVIIISDQTRADYFDGDKNAVGNYVEIDNNRYRVIGVVKRVSAAFKFQYGDAFLPYTESKSARLTSKNNDGPFIATILVDEKKNLSKVQQEYHQMISKVRLDGSTYDKMHSYAGSYLSTFTRSFADSDSSDSILLSALSSYFFCYCQH